MAIRADYTQYVNPLMGTLSSFELSAGNTYPAIALPWGMNFWTPSHSRNGRRMAIHLQRHRDTRFQTNSPAQPVD